MKEPFPEAIDQRLVRSLAHPLRIQILELLTDQVASPNASRRAPRGRPQRRRLPHPCARRCGAWSSSTPPSAAAPPSISTRPPRTRSSATGSGGGCRAPCRRRLRRPPCRPSSTRRSPRWRPARSTAATTPSSAGCRSCSSTRRAWRDDESSTCDRWNETDATRLTWSMRRTAESPARLSARRKGRASDLGDRSALDGELSGDPRTRRGRESWRGPERVRLSAAPATPTRSSPAASRRCRGRRG